MRKSCAARPMDRPTGCRRVLVQVQRSIAWLARGHRRVPYRGVTKNDAWLHLRAAAINLRRLLTLGLTGTHSTWALAS
jgi:IS5 family transposase